MAGHIASSSNVDWNTPRLILDGVKEVYGGAIDLDPCSNETSLVGAKVEYRLPRNGLALPWKLYDNTRVFVNPPYGTIYYSADFTSTLTSKEHGELMKLAKEGDLSAKAKLAMHPIKYSLYDWVDKCAKEFIYNSVESTLLIPIATDTSHWQDLIFKYASKILFPKGRIKFLDNGVEMKSPPMPSGLIYFGTHGTMFSDTFNRYGKVISL